MNIAVFGRKVTKQNAEYYSEILGILKDFGWNPVLHKDLKDLLELSIISNTKSTKKSKFPIFLLLSVAYGSSIGGMATLVGSPPNIQMAGILEKNFQIQLYIHLSQILKHLNY